MSDLKVIDAILDPPAPHMVGDGFRVHNFFPGHFENLVRFSPFFLMDYGSKIEFNPSVHPRGVGVHPHRGFETVTLSYYGKVAHHDSWGNSGVIGEGDVQWMTAGSGVLHKEYHEEEFSKKGGMFQMVQLWVNLPAKDKMVTPKYQDINRGKLGNYQIDGGLGVVEVVAGEYKGIKGPASTFTPIYMYNARPKKGAKLDFEFPELYNTGVLVVEGKAIINGEEVSADQFALFKNKGIKVEVEATEDSILLVLSGEPINEPIVAYGPFLMNNKQEIMQAYDDFHKGKFGVLED